MMDLERLGREIAREQDALPARDQARERTRARLLARKLSPSIVARARPRWIALAAALSLLVTLVLVWASARQPALMLSVGRARVPASAGTWIDAPETRPLPLFFSDGSFMEMAPRSRARVLELTAHGARLLVESGRLRVEVAHRPGQHWSLTSGSFTVRVTGTRFDLGYEPERDGFDLVLEEGQVELSGCVFGSGRRLVAGQRVRASCKAPRVEVAYNYDPPLAAPSAPPAQTQTPTPMAETAALPSSAPEASAETSATRPRADAAVPSTLSSSGLARTLEAPPAARWIQLARQRLYAEALAAAEASGFERECQRGSAAELALLADTARHAARQHRALTALTTLRQRFPGTKDAELAAFSLGLIEFDAFREYAKAADWFKTYLRERPTGRLAQEAQGRLMEAMQRVGNHAEARSLALKYLLDYPTGPYAELASRVASSR